ncbi:MAG: hypothetical protein ABWX94_00050 [Candidatus Saccharimonadales bacterium]
MADIGRMAFTVNVDGRSSLRSLRGLNFLAMSATGVDDPGIASFVNRRGLISTYVSELTVSNLIRESSTQYGGMTSTPRRHYMAAGVWGAFQRGLFRPDVCLPYDNLPQPIQDNFRDISLYFELHSNRGVLYEPGRIIVDRLQKAKVVGSLSQLAAMTQLTTYDFIHKDVDSRYVGVLPNDMALDAVIENVANDRIWTAPMQTG